ncbi:MAG: carbohydrate binding domain-containing protein [Spirochaetaceae bacterium]|jgi:hypothetical protein|nr:carbohydrate binding domain-containing protein [Spirochaetaceae bacterium]
MPPKEIIQQFLPNQKKENASVSIASGYASITYLRGGSLNYSVQYSQDAITLQEGVTYDVTFLAKASSARSIEMNVGQAVSPWGSYSGARSFDITSSWTSYTFSFVMEGPLDSNARLEFNLGTNSSNVQLDDITITQQ